MSGPSRRKFRCSAAVAVASALAVGVAGYAAPANAAPVTGRAPGPGLVAPVPASGTPELVPSSGKAQDRIRQLVQCGGLMYAVGKFGTISQQGKPYTRNNVFSFSATAPYAVTSWAPDVNGEVNSITFTKHRGCADAYIGGNFTTVQGTAAKNIAEVSTSTGAVVTGFGHSASGPVETLLGVGGRLLVGGMFHYLNGSQADPYMAGVNPGTGRDDGFLHLKLSGHYHYCNSSGKCTTGEKTYAYNQQLSHGGTLDLVEGDFTSAGGLPRQQIFMLNLATDPATVTKWTSPQWDGSEGNLPHGYPYQCYVTESFYVRAAAWSPNDSTVYIADTGFHPYNVPKGSPRSGLCDSTAAFPATQARVKDRWISYDGCYSLYSVAADTSTVYVAGHPLYQDDPDGCKTAGPGAIPDRGMAGLRASNGTDRLRSNGKALYTMSRANADDMLLTSAGLWIASSNRFGSQDCGTRPGHSGICFLPYRSA